MFVLGITGAARAGKDTLANIIIESMPASAPIHRISLARPIKDMLVIALKGLGYAEHECTEMVDGRHKTLPIPVLNVTPRSLLQTLGTEWGRHLVSPDLWINIAQNTLGSIKAHDDIAQTNSLVLITDIRYNNEADKLCDLVVKVERYEDTDSGDPHTSEAGLSTNHIDLYAYNPGTLDGFRKTTVELRDILFHQLAGPTHGEMGAL